MQDLGTKSCTYLNSSKVSVPSFEQLSFAEFSEKSQRSKVNSVQEPCAKCSEITQISWKKWNKGHQTLFLHFSSINLAFGCILFCSFILFERFQILICEPQTIWRKLLVLSWLTKTTLKRKGKKFLFSQFFKDSFKKVENLSRTFEKVELGVQVRSCYKRVHHRLPDKSQTQNDMSNP